MDSSALADHFTMLAGYNRSANERLYKACAALPESEYWKQRRGSFGSIHALLNHVLIFDRIWMGGSKARDTKHRRWPRSCSRILVSYRRPECRKTRGSSSSSTPVDSTKTSGRSPSRMTTIVDSPM